MLTTRICLPVLMSAMIACGALPKAANAIPFNQISQVYFFGDSSTDSGFNDLWPTVAHPPQLPMLPPGKAPTSTSFGGYTWAQYVARDIKGYTLPIYPGPTPADTITNNSIYVVPGFNNATLTSVNYACSGSTTNSTGVGAVTWAPSLHQQVAYYLATAPAQLDPNAIYFIFSGTNDLIGPLLTAPPLPTQVQLLQAASTAATNIANEAANLSARGAKRIVVFSMPSLGSLPLITGLSATFPTLPATMKNLTFTFNSMLNTQLGNVIKMHGAKILYVDVYTLLDDMINATKAGKPFVIAGKSFTFANYTLPACGATFEAAMYCPNGAPTNFIFASVKDPTDLTHQVIATDVENLLAKWK
jgi:outer membrane lipase/esterase